MESEHSWSFSQSEIVLKHPLRKGQVDLTERKSYLYQNIKL